MSETERPVINILSLASGSNSFKNNIIEGQLIRLYPTSAIPYGFMPIIKTNDDKVIVCHDLVRDNEYNRNLLNSIFNIEEQIINLQNAKQVLISNFERIQTAELKEIFKDDLK